jgi:DNA-binding MarR family transcriptional regulator
MAARLVTRRYDRALAPAGVTANGFAILAHLDPEVPLALGVLADRLAMDRSTLSREVAPLVASGLVDASADAGDRRKHLLALSAAGTALVTEARPLWAAAQASLEDGFGTDRAAELVAELQALVGAAS